jgi:uncharacterized membrane protein YfhO
LGKNPRQRPLVSQEDSQGRVKDKLPAPEHAPVLTGPLEKRCSLLLTSLVGLCLLLVGVLIFRDFLFNGAVLLYKDIGNDSIKSYYPDFVHLSNYIRSQGFPSWSFHIGMGQDLAYATGYLIWQPVSWLPKELIAPALIFQHLGKILIVGLLFFRFLQLRRFQAPAPLLGSLLLSFSAYMCMGSCWYPLTDEVVCFAAILLGTETALQGRRWITLALGTALVGMINPFYLYLCALFLIFYVPLRLFGQYGWQPRRLLRRCFALAAVAALGSSLGAIVTLPSLDVVLNSLRGSGATSARAVLSSFPLFGLESTRHYITAVLRPFANDMLGVGDAFQGWQNYLEAPLTYCGLLCLIIFPQALIAGRRQSRIIAVLFLAGMLIPTVFPWFRYLFWLFQGDYYRTYSLFWILGVITLSSVAFSRYAEGRALNLWMLAASTILLSGILYLPVGELQNHINRGLRSAATAYLLLYGTVLAAGQLAQRQKLAAYLIVGLAAVELVQFARITVSDRKTVSKQELNHGIAHDRETIEAVQDIRRDDDTFFRITKLRLSDLGTEIDPNGSMLLGYYSTSSYSSFNNLNYIRFLKTVDAIPTNLETDTRWAVGLAGNFVLSMFACEKYALVEDPLPFRNASQYELIRQYGKYYLLRNNLFLPLGLTFTHYLPEELFRQLSRDEKEQVLLVVAVLSSEEEAQKQGLQEITIPELKTEMAASSFPETIERRRKSALKLTSFRQTRIEGNVHLDQKSILVIQTPFDHGWRAFQDGQSVPVLKADVGLLGVGLDGGEHKVELHYRNPLLVPALSVTLASFLILVAALWRWPRLGLSA